MTFATAVACMDELKQNTTAECRQKTFSEKKMPGAVRQFSVCMGQSVNWGQITASNKGDFMHPG